MGNMVEKGTMAMVHEKGEWIRLQASYCRWRVVEQARNVP